MGRRDKRAERKVVRCKRYPARRYGRGRGTLQVMWVILHSNWMGTQVEGQRTGLGGESIIRWLRKSICLYEA